MFGCIVAGRLVQTNFQQVDQTKFLIQLENAEEINHIVVFMTGEQPFPEGYAATVHFLWPTTENPHWQLLGMVSNDKPSAVFKLGGKKSASTTFHLQFNTNTNPVGGFYPLIQSGSNGNVVAQLGISIEPIQQVTNQCSSVVLASSSSSQSGNQPSLSMVGNMATKIAQNLFDYCASFAITSANMGGSQNNTFVPMKTLQDWFNNIQRKLKADPNYFNK